MEKGKIIMEKEKNFFPSPYGNVPLVLQVEVDVGDYAHVLDVRRVAVAILDGELSLRGVLDLAQLAVAVGSELLGCCAGVLRGFLNHAGLDLVEPVVEVGSSVFPSREGCYALVHQLALIVAELDDGIHLRGAYCDDAGNLEVVSASVVPRCNCPFEGFMMVGRRA